MSSSDLVQSLSRGLTLLQHVAASDDGATLAQLCDAVRLKEPTAHNLLRTLVAHGFLEKVAGPTRYRLGPAAMRLGDQHRQRGLLRRVEAALVELHLRFPHGRFSFMEGVGGDVVTTLRVAPEQPQQVQRGSVQSMPPYTTASALLHQALWPVEAREAYRRRYPFAEYGGHAWPSEEDMEAFLANVRRRGYAEPRFAFDHHYRLAAPVLGDGRRFIGAMGAHVPEADDATGWDPVPLREAVLHAARSVSAIEPAPHQPESFVA